MTVRQEAAFRKEGDRDGDAEDEDDPRRPDPEDGCPKLCDEEQRDQRIRKPNNENKVCIYIRQRTSCQ